MFIKSSYMVWKTGAWNTFCKRKMSVMYKALKYDNFGEPTKVLQLVEDVADKPKDNNVLVKILAAPINPADVNTIQGKYPVKPVFPAVGGNEGVGEVVAVGENVKNLTEGQKVLLIASGVGSWRTYGIFTEQQLFPISSTLGLAEAATLTVNPCTAYRMLKDFVRLSPGDTVIQNGANSAVGQAVHQLCKAWDVNSVGIVRDRPDINELKEHLKCLGATEVLTEEEVRTTKLFKDGTLKKPVLGLNCVGAKSATELSRHLQDKGTLVTYGGMSREPVTVSTAALIFKDISFRGYWMTRWTKENANSEAQKQMFGELSKMIEKGQIKAVPHEFIALHDFKRAEESLNLKGYSNKKFIFKMQ